MAMKPNYRQERAQRTRAKAEKKQKKLERQQEAVDQRKASRDDDDVEAPESTPGAASSGEDDGRS